MSWLPLRIVPLFSRAKKTLKRRQEPRRKLRLDFEQLEKRELMATIQFQSSAIAVNEDAGTATVVVTLSAPVSSAVTVQYASSDGTAVAGSDYTTASGTLNIPAFYTSGTFTVKITDDQVSESGETITLTLSSPTNATLGSPSSSTLTITNVTSSLWVTTGQQRLTDPFQSTILPFGSAGFDPNRGAAVLVHDLDHRRGDAGANDAWNRVGTDPALVYRSDTVNVKPILEANFATEAGLAVPTSLVLTLTWNGGAAQSNVTFTSSGNAGDSFVIADLVSSAVSSTGRYTWQLDVKATFTNRGDVLRTVTGTTSVIVNGSSSPFGYGWSLAGLDKLISDASGVLWVYGVGGSRYFTGTSGTLTNPANDFGTMVRNGDSTWTYTAKDQVKWYFDTAGVLTKIVDPHSLTRTFTYSSGNLSKIEEPDGAVTTFNYSSGLLSTVQEPGGRTVTFSYTSSDLTGITNPDAGVRTFTYDGSHKLTNDKFGPLNTTFTYDGTNGSLTNLDRGQSTTLGLTAAAVAPLTTNPAKKSTEVVAGLLDGLSQRTTYTLDGLGRTTKILYFPAMGGNNETWTLNSAGLPTKHTDQLNRTTTFTYSGSDLTQIEYPSSITFTGGIATLAYDSTYHTPTLYQDTLGNRTTFTYDAANGDLLTMKNALNQVTTFTWSSGLLSTIKDPLGNTTTFTYDTSYRRLTEVRDALSNRTTFTYDTKGSLDTVKDALGRVTTFVFDSMRRLTSQTNALAGQMTFTYNAVGDVTSTTNPRGYRTDHTYYDGTGLQKTMVEAAGTGAARTTTWAYDARGFLTSMIDALGHRTTITYSTTSADAALKNAVNAVQTVTYDAAMQLTNYRDGRNNLYTLAYDFRGRQTTLTDPLSNVAENVYDTEGSVTTYIDQRGYRTTFTYDALNRVETVKDALSNVTTFVYDAGGNLQAVVDGRGNRTTFVYDAIHQRTAVTDALNHTRTWVYDAVGKVSERLDALGHRVTFTYDALNRRETRKRPSLGVTTFAYDANSNRVNLIDALGNKTTFVYDAFDRQTEIIDARGGRTTFVYDAADNLTNLIDPVGNKTTFVYDNADRLTEEIDPRGKSFTFAYDAADNLTSRTDRLVRRRDFTYDELNRLTKEEWITSGSTVNTLTFTYDANSNLLTAHDADGRITFTYDAVNRRDTQKDLWGLTLTFTYDAVGNRTKVQDSQSGVTTSTYSAVNLLTKREFGGSGLTPLRTDLTYTDRNQLATISNYSDLAGSTLVGSTTFTYDTSKRLTNLQHRNSGGSLLANFTYTYDVGNRLETEVTNGTTKTFTYDATNQLTNDGTTAFTYDLNGNRTMSGYTTDTGNRLTNDGVYTFTYDDEGNLTRKSKGTSLETWDYTYDHWNHMLTAEKRDAVGGNLQMVATYVYDALGNRIEKRVDADGAGGGGVTTTRFANDLAHPGGLAEVWADLDGSSALTMRYVRGDATDQLFARITSGGTASWYLTDRLGSTRNMVDAGGTLTNTVTYDGFGNVLTETGSGDRWKWTGREFDSETGLQFNRWRYYDSDTGRWTTEDPIRWEAGDANVSRYVFNIPVNFIDPSGEILHLVVAGAVLGAWLLWPDEVQA